MYLIELLFNSLHSQDLWILEKSHWNWVQTDLIWSLLGESAPSWQLNLTLVLYSTTGGACVCAGNRLFCYILFSVMLLRIEIPLLPHTSKAFPSASLRALENLVAFLIHGW